MPLCTEPKPLAAIVSKLEASYCLENLSSSVSPGQAVEKQLTAHAEVLEKQREKIISSVALNSRLLQRLAAHRIFRLSAVLSGYRVQ